MDQVIVVYKYKIYMKMKEIHCFFFVFSNKIVFKTLEIKYFVPFVYINIIMFERMEILIETMSWRDTMMLEFVLELV